MIRNITRRRFFHAAGVLTLPVVFRRKKRASAGECPRLRFVQCNDAHLQDAAIQAYRGANDRLSRLIDLLNAEAYFPLPDFVLGVGDMIHGETLAKLAPDFALLTRKLARLKCPFYPAVGNHENVQQEGDPRHEAAYRETFAAERLNYSFTRGGLHFIVFNNSGAPRSNGTPAGRAHRQWLQRQLEVSDVPTIICCHVPLIPLREETVLRKSFGFASYAARNEELLSLVDLHARRIPAVLSGHLHLTGMVPRKGVCHVAVSGTAGYPHDFALYEVFDDCIRARVYSLPAELSVPETDIHGRPRHKEDFTDAAHPTHELYVRGCASERAFEIPLC